jgi:hypothetical protein
MTVRLKAPSRALLLFGFGVLGGCTEAAKDYNVVDLQQHVPLFRDTSAAAQVQALQLPPPPPALPQWVCPDAQPVLAGAPTADAAKKQIDKTMQERLPPELANDTVIKAALTQVAQHRFRTKASVVRATSPGRLRALFASIDLRATSPTAAEAASTGKDESAKAALADHYDEQANQMQTSPLTLRHFMTLHRGLISAVGDRSLHYIGYYFDGKMTDRLGNTLGKPTFTDSKVSNDDISGLLNAILESLADADPDHASPVWFSGTGATTKYYPGESTDVPAALLYSADGDETKYPTLASKMNDKELGCGMTVLKAQAIRLASNSAGVWAKSGSGLVMGLFGGVGGAFVLFGKVSIGDNQTLQALVQTVLSFTARRAVYEGTVKRLFLYEQQKNDKLQTLVTLFGLVAPPADGSTATTGTTKAAK